MNKKQGQPIGWPCFLFQPSMAGGESLSGDVIRLDVTDALAIRQGSDKRHDQGFNKPKPFHSGYPDSKRHFPMAAMDHREQVSLFKPNTPSLAVFLDRFHHNVFHIGLRVASLAMAIRLIVVLLREGGVIVANPRDDPYIVSSRIRSNLFNRIKDVTLYRLFPSYASNT